MKFVMKLDVTKMPGNTGLQGAKFDPVGSHWYLAQAIGAGPGDDEHTRIHRFSEGGEWQGFVQLNHFGHCSTFGFNAPHLWVSYAMFDAKGHTLSTKAARVDTTHIDWAQHPSLSVRNTDTVMVVPSKLGTSIVPFGPSADGIYLRWGRAETTEFLKVDLSDFRSMDRPKILAHIITQKSGLVGSFQGCTTKSGHLWVLNGNTNIRNRISEFDWADGRRVSYTDVTPELVRSTLQDRVTTLSSVEPEGLGFYSGKMIMGVRTGPPGVRRDFALVSV